LKAKFYILLLIIFSTSCSQINSVEKDEKLLSLLLNNSIQKSEHATIDIIYNPAPSNFKNMKVEFDFFQINFVNKDSLRTEVRYFAVIDGEIYRIGKGPDCIIFSKEIRWNSKGELISNFKMWYEKNSIENELYTKKPEGALKTYNNEMVTDNSLPENIKKVICK
jgi:hypothetical protein